MPMYFYTGKDFFFIYSKILKIVLLQISFKSWCESQKGFRLNAFLHFSIKIISRNYDYIVT